MAASSSPGARQVFPGPTKKCSTETRRSPLLEVGVSTRGALAWYRAAQAYALMAGREFCVPDDFKELAVPALAHRVMLSAAQESLGRARQEAERAIGDVLTRVEVPG